MARNRLTPKTVAEEPAPISGLPEIGMIMPKSGRPDFCAGVSKGRSRARWIILRGFLRSAKSASG